MNTLCLSAVLIWSAAVAVFDLTKRRIPNPVSIGAAVLALIVLAVQGESVAGGSVESVFAAFGLVLALTLPAYAAGVLGAGDVKLAAAMALLTDFDTVALMFVMGSLMGGIWATLWLAARICPRLVPWLHATSRMRGLARADAPKRPVPFGAALAAGLALSLLSGASFSV
jgi:prepilin peptidase CpaA